MESSLREVPNDVREAANQRLRDKTANRYWEQKQDHAEIGQNSAQDIKENRRLQKESDDWNREADLRMAAIQNRINQAKADRK